jgi:PIN domain nuclease of toxin-antitoxin system
MECNRIKIKTHLGIGEWIEQAFSLGSLKEATFNRQVAAMTQSIALEHGDPADRFLAATAAVYDLTLVTADEKLLRGKGFRTLANA